MRFLNVKYLCPPSLTKGKKTDKISSDGVYRWNMGTDAPENELWVPDQADVGKGIKFARFDANAGGWIQFLVTDMADTKDELGKKRVRAPKKMSLTPGFVPVAGARGRNDMAVAAVKRVGIRKVASELIQARALLHELRGSMKRLLNGTMVWLNPIETMQDRGMLKMHGQGGGEESENVKKFGKPARHHRTFTRSPHTPSPSEGRHGGMSNTAVTVNQQGSAGVIIGTAGSRGPQATGVSGGVKPSKHVMRPSAENSNSRRMLPNASPGTMQQTSHMADVQNGTFENSMSGATLSGSRGSNENPGSLHGYMESTPCQRKPSADARASSSTGGNQQPTRSMQRDSGAGPSWANDGERVEEAGRFGFLNLIDRELSSDSDSEDESRDESGVVPMDTADTPEVQQAEVQQEHENRPSVENDVPLPAPNPQQADNATLSSDVARLLLQAIERLQASVDNLAKSSAPHTVGLPPTDGNAPVAPSTQVPTSVEEGPAPTDIIISDEQFLMAASATTPGRRLNIICEAHWGLNMMSQYYLASGRLNPRPSDLAGIFKLVNRIAEYRGDRDEILTQARFRVMLSHLFCEARRTVRGREADVEDDPADIEPAINDQHHPAAGENNAHGEPQEELMDLGNEDIHSPVHGPSYPSDFDTCGICLTAGVCNMEFSPCYHRSCSKCGNRIGQCHVCRCVIQKKALVPIIGAPMIVIEDSDEEGSDTEEVSDTEEDQ